MQNHSEWGVVTKRRKKKKKGKKKKYPLLPFYIKLFKEQLLEKPEDNANCSLAEFEENQLKVIKELEWGEELVEWAMCELEQERPIDIEDESDSDSDSDDDSEPQLQPQPQPQPQPSHNHNDPSTQHDGDSSTSSSEQQDDEDATQQEGEDGDEGETTPRHEEGEECGEDQFLGKNKEVPQILALQKTNRFALLRILCFDPSLTPEEREFKEYLRDIFFTTYTIYFESDNVLLGHFYLIYKQTHPHFQNLPYSSDVRLEILKIVRQWIEFYPSKFIYTTIRSLLKQWLAIIKKEVIESEAEGKDGEFLKKLSQSVCKIEKILPEGWADINVTLEPQSSLDLKCRFDLVSHTILDDHSAQELAEQMTLMDWQGLKSTSFDDYHGCKWTKSNAYLICPNLMKSINNFNKVSYWIQTQIVSTQSKEEGARLISLFIKISKEFRKLRNFQGMMAISSALNTSSISRLKSVWALLTERDKAHFDALQNLFCATENFKGYRKRFAEASKPALPFLGLFLRDLTIINEIPSDFDDGSINYYKMRSISKILLKIKECKDYGYKYEHSITALPSLQNFLKAVVNFEIEKDDSSNVLLQNKILSEDSIFNASMKMERKKAKKGLLTRARRFSFGGKKSTTMTRVHLHEDPDHRVKSNSCSNISSLSAYSSKNKDREKAQIYKNPLNNSEISRMVVSGQLNTGGSLITENEKKARRNTISSNSLSYSDSRPKSLSRATSLQFRHSSDIHVISKSPRKSPRISPRKSPTTLRRSSSVVAKHRNLDEKSPRLRSRTGSSMEKIPTLNFTYEKEPKASRSRSRSWDP